MATESFGASFGNPSRYMGSSPLGEIGKALKTGAMVYGMEKSGLIKYLDELGVKQKNGGFSFENKKDATIPGAVSPIDQVPQAGGPMTYGNKGAASSMSGAVAPDGITQVPQAGGPLFSSYNPTTMTNVYGVNTGVNKEFAPATSGVTTPEAAPVPMPRLQGIDILDGRVEMNPNDYDPRENYGYTQQLASGNEYQNSPGYGSTAKKMSSFFGMA
jgi:hypothetical protein